MLDIFLKLFPALSTNGSLAFLLHHEAYQERVVTSYDRVTHLEVETFVYICHIFRQYCLHICIGRFFWAHDLQLIISDTLDCMLFNPGFLVCSQFQAVFLPDVSGAFVWSVGQKLKQESCDSIPPLKSSHRMMIWERDGVALDRPTCDNRDKLSSRLTDVWLTMG